MIISHAYFPDSDFLDYYYLELLRQQHHIVSYELGICAKCIWYCVRDDGHVLLLKD